MNNDIKIEIDEIISLANGDPESILPGLFASKRARTPTPDPEETATPEQSRDSPAPIPDPFSPQRKKLKLNNYVHSSKTKYHGMQATTLRSLLSENLIGFLQEHNLIARAVECHCGKQMKLQTYKKVDGCQWICQHPKKNEKGKMTIRKGTFFYNSRLKIEDILMLSYMWVHEYSQISMMHESRVAPDTLTHWITRCQDVCQAALEYKNDPLGGEDRSVEVYESKFKNGKDDKWAFCALEQFTTKSILIIVHDKSSKSIVQIFDKYFLPGTVVVSQIWCAMKNLKKDDFEYLTEEKSLTFYDQVTRQEMKEHEDFKQVTRRPYPGANKYNKMDYGTFFFERMYRKSLQYAPDAFLAFLEDVSVIYAPCIKNVKNSNSED
ncbi:hypothetical protein JTE90_016572 [Oedothorax gibbosus]|uniref:Transposase n=1 Tax=Oedothorax gibbosus TaxID=931172 RepID=A0AAV6UAX8_9ARAC|nr:hypothetical protein JTE90_016572 [Oedothorax gibbosus]